MFIHIIECIFLRLYLVADNEELSEFLKELRKEVGLTEEEFADRAGVALTVIIKN